MGLFKGKTTAQLQKEVMRAEKAAKKERKRQILISRLKAAKSVKNAKRREQLKKFAKKVNAGAKRAAKNYGSGSSMMFEPIGNSGGGRKRKPMSYDDIGINNI